MSENGLEAIDYLFGKGKYSGRDINQQPEIILIDLRMPKMDGIGRNRGFAKNTRRREFTQYPGGNHHVFPFVIGRTGSRQGRG
jgi:CheY-like chemotaxis protein